MPIVFEHRNHHRDDGDVENQRGNGNRKKTVLPKERCENRNARESNVGKCDARRLNRRGTQSVSQQKHADERNRHEQSKPSHQQCQHEWRFGEKRGAWCTCNADKEQRGQSVPKYQFVESRDLVAVESLHAPRAIAQRKHEEHGREHAERAEKGRHVDSYDPVRAIAIGTTTTIETVVSRNVEAASASYTL